MRDVTHNVNVRFHNIVTEFGLGCRGNEFKSTGRNLKIGEATLLAECTIAPRGCRVRELLCWDVNRVFEGATMARASVGLAA